MNVDARNIPLPPSRSSSLSPPTQPPHPSEDIPHVYTSLPGGNSSLPRPDHKDEPSSSQNVTKEQGKIQDQAAKVS